LLRWQEEEVLGKVTDTYSPGFAMRWRCHYLTHPDIT
jgi:hypothetical protein